jgi:hypothetical protein
MYLDRQHTAFSFKNAPIKIIATEIGGPPANRAVKTGGPICHSRFSTTRQIPIKEKGRAGKVRLARGSNQGPPNRQPGCSTGSMGGGQNEMQRKNQ